MKKNALMTVLSATAAATMIVGMLAGCGGKTSATKDADGATVIKFGINVANPAKQEPATNAIVEAFNKENKGKYKVQFEAADTESHNKNMKLEASDGTLPQVFWVEGSQVTGFNESGVLLDLKDFLKQNPNVKKALNGSEKAFQDDSGVQVRAAVPEQRAGHFLQQGVVRQGRCGISERRHDI